jgi:4-diphosphocytidyl-2-C-methyl-D-erythritol kinase
MAIGIGHLEPLIPLEVDVWAFNLVLSVPNVGLPTAAVYSMYDQITEQVTDVQCYPKRRLRCLSANRATKEPHSLVQLLAKDPEEAAMALLPDVKLALDAGRSAGAITSRMAGTGSICVFLPENSAHAEILATIRSKTSIFWKVLTVTGPVPDVQENSSA